MVASVESRLKHPGNKMSRSEMGLCRVYHRKRISWIKGLDGSLMPKVQVWKGENQGRTLPVLAWAWSYQ